jgi:hypothetical protein
VILGPTARVALYYAPADDDSLAEAAAAWFTAHPDLTADARRYGFHATLKPPMRLRTGCGWAELRKAVETIAATVAPFALPPLRIADILGFLALREARPSMVLQAFADACVAAVDHLRAPPDAAELERRQRSGLSPAEAANLARWGYPYVFATWFFHMTLTRRLTEAEQAALLPEAEAAFASAIAAERMVTDLCLFVEPAPGKPFTLAERVKLRG